MPLFKQESMHLFSTAVHPEGISENVTNCIYKQFRHLQPSRICTCVPAIMQLQSMGVVSKLSTAVHGGGLKIVDCSPQGKLSQSCQVVAVPSL